MSSDVMQMVPVRMPSELVDRIDGLVAVLGGNRSEFVRMAVEERLQRMAQVVEMLATDGAPA